MAAGPTSTTKMPGKMKITRGKISLTAVLAAGGATWDHVVKTTIYLTDLNDFATVNRIYAELVGSAPPSRATVQVAALPKGAAVEVDAIAHLGARA